jgi:hypothetical protein
MRVEAEALLPPPASAQDRFWQEGRVISVENFTTLPHGAVVLEGVVSTCPRCGRSGIERPTEWGGKICLHVQSTEIIGDGMVTEAVESCPLTDVLSFDLRGEGVV